LTTFLKVVAIVVVLAGVGVGFVFLRGYAWRIVFGSGKKAELRIAKPPWVTSQLEQMVRTAAQANGEDLTIDEDLTKSVLENLQKLLPWIEDVNTGLYGDSLHVTGHWRKPLVLVESRTGRFYVDVQQVVLEYVEIPTLPIVKVRGLSTFIDSPPVGKPLRLDDLGAAIAIVDLLDRMDREQRPDKPLLNEIAAIDVSNFGGRGNARDPHIVLYAKDDIQIIWGAEKDAWAQNLEATDEEKLAKLYGYYKENGTLLGSVKYINLRAPQDRVPQPIDRY